jgi:hypothetical protein
MSDPFSIRPELSADLLGHINRGVFDRGIFAIPGDAIRPGGGTRPLGERVQPGDLITADLINFILARLDALEQRPTPTVPTVTTPTLPTLTFVPTFPTFTFPTIFTMPTFPTFTTFPTLTAGPTIFTMVPTLTIGPTGPIFTMVPTLTIGPGGGLATNLATNLATVLGGLATMGGISPTVGGITIRREDSVTNLPGVGRDEETRLRGAGIRNLGEIADADPVVLGNTLGVQPTDAARMIGIARGALGPR